MTQRKLASASNGIKTGDGTGVGFFIPLPEELAGQFPSLGDEDRSPPHCTFLYVGKVDKDREDRFIQAVQGALSNIRGTVRGSLYGPEYFVHTAKERRVAVMRVRFNQDLAALRWKLRDAIQEAGFNVDDSFPLIYSPHVTLQYFEDMIESYEGKIPHGEWGFNGIEVWGLSKVYTVGFGEGSMKTASVIVYHGTRGGFDSLDPNKSGLGTHFGDYRAAVARVKPIRESNPEIRKYQLNISKPFKMIDVVKWESPSHVAYYLAAGGVLEKQYQDKFLRQSASFMWDYMRRALEKAGYDSVVYINEWEDKGSRSYIVWDNSKIQRLPDVKKTASDKSTALMKFLSAVARKLGVGKSVFIVGGAVRNHILGIPAKDLDIVIDSIASGKGKDSEWFAKELQKAIPVQTSLVTNQYGVAIISIRQKWELEGQNLEGEVIEIANARKESYGEGGYRPTETSPATIEEDILRRDFSMNSLMWRLYDVADGPDRAEIIDLAGCGVKDLQEGTLRCPSDPDKTFGDDPSRIIRLIRFLIKYGFKIDPLVEASARRNVQKIKNIPPGHLSNMIINTFYETGVGKRALLEMDKLGILDVIKDIIQTNKSFREALGNWAEKHADIGFIFDLMDLYMPVGHALSFLTPAQKTQLRDNLVGFSTPEAAEDYVTVLQQPGKIVNMPKLIGDLSLKGPGIKLLTDNLRQMMLDDPALLHTSDHLESLVKLRMGGLTRTASLKEVKGLLAAFISEARDAGCEVKNLGDVGGLPILLIHPQEVPQGTPRMLVIGGVHGDEPSGVNVCLEILKNPPKSVSLSFIPMMNPVGRKRDTREDVKGKDPNRGWTKGKATPEGKILKANEELLRELGWDGVLSIHEDSDDEFYIYDGEGLSEPGPLAHLLLDTGKQFFEVAPDRKDTFGNSLKDGFILNSHDDSFEDWMTFSVGTRPVMLVELPAKHPFDLRVKGGVAIVYAFAEYLGRSSDRVASRYLANMGR